ncbi:MAG: endonuclease III domain-containing protein [Phycisphaerae bacterium]
MTVRTGTSIRSKIRLIIRHLEKAYGPQRWRCWGRPLDGLIGTVLSQHTSDTNSDAAFRGLKRAFATWKACMDAPTEQVERAIRCGGLARQKTRSIQAILRFIHADRGRLSLEFLRRRPMERARTYLLGLPGVGPKTAACVLLFNLGKPALPVDTHVYRVAWRLGLIPEDATVEDAHQILEPACPPKQVYAFHVHLIRHGREVCKARNPRCGKCVLANICPSAQVKMGNGLPKLKQRGRIGV